MQLNDQMSLGDIDPAYEAFTEKFVPKKTTDDCYTPPAVYDAIVSWVVENYGIDTAAIVRPFYPGGDFERFDYPENCVVLDNPPFSILTRIVRFYMEHGVKFFLFAPTLTTLEASRDNACAVIVDAKITYENGAVVNTSFVTNLDGLNALVTAPGLRADIMAAQRAGNVKRLPRYTMPHALITAAAANRYANSGIYFSVRKSECVFVRKLDAMKPYNKSIFGGGLLMSNTAQERRTEADEMRRWIQTEFKAPECGADYVWELSDREQTIVNNLEAE